MTRYGRGVPRGLRALQARRKVRFLVNSGVTYTVLLGRVWRSIGLKPLRGHEFTLADGTIIRRKVSECYLMLPQGEGHTSIVLGEADDQSLLGVVTLKILGLVFNSFKRTLQPCVCS